MTNQLKAINQVTQVPMDCWQVAEELFGKKALAQNHLLAGEAARQMKQDGWSFSRYDSTYGEEVYNPPQRKCYV